jgi:hypothetical protein
MLIEDIPASWNGASRTARISGCRSSRSEPNGQLQAVGYVLENWYANIIETSGHPKLPQYMRHAMAVIVKTTIIRHLQRGIPELAERCAAQGMITSCPLKCQKN